MKRKKEIYVLHIITRLDLGGAQKVCLLLVEGLRSQGIPTKLVSGTTGELTSYVTKTPGVLLLKEFQHPVSPLGLFTDARCFIRLISIIRKLKKEHPCLIVHTHSTKAGIMGRWAAFFAGAKKRVHTIHGYAFHKHQNKLSTFFIYLCELITSFITTHFICVSSVDVKKGVHCFPLFRKRHSIIRAAVNWQQFFQPGYSGNPFPKQDETFIFGTIASLKKGKNLFELLKAFELVHQYNPHTKLEIIGGGVLQPSLEKWIHAHKFNKVVTLYGWQHQVLPIMKRWHCFSFSSLWEGLPCTVVEARLQKLPVVSYRTGGIPDVIMHGENGLLYKQRDWKGLANGMLTISKNRCLYDKLQAYNDKLGDFNDCLLYTSPSPRDATLSRMPSSA